MAKKKGFGVSPITNTIFHGTQDTEKQMWIGQKTDVTDEVVGVVFQWFMGQIERENSEAYSITYQGTGYELVMRRKQEKEENAE